MAEVCSATDMLSGSRPGPAEAVPSLRTDLYELTMIEAALSSGAAPRRAVFEVFARWLPHGRRYGVVAGLARLVEAVETFRFGAEELEYLRSTGALADSTLDFLAGYRFSGSVTGYREGELYFPYSPVLTVEGSFAEAVVLETVVLSILNHDSAVASAAARMVDAAAGRPLIEMGSRRTDETAAPHAARAAYLCGFAATSNLEAGRSYGIPVRGTVAHAFVLAHPSELDAFRAQVAAFGPATTMLVDTYDVAQGVRNAVAAAGPELGAVRIDSGDLLREARLARELLDGLGATGTKILVSGDVDEHRIAELVGAGAPIDAFGVGTSVVTGSGAPTAGFVYKLVAVADDNDRALRPVAKRSPGKSSPGGVKTAWRVLDGDGRAQAEHVGDEAVPPDGRPLQVTTMANGVPLASPSLEEIRNHHRTVLEELVPEHRSLPPGPPAFTAGHA